MRLTVRPADGVAEDADDQTVNIMQANLAFANGAITGTLRKYFYEIIGSMGGHGFKEHFIAVNFENVPPAPYKTTVYVPNCGDVTITGSEPYFVIPYDSLLDGTTLRFTVKCTLDEEVISSASYQFDTSGIVFDDSIYISEYPDPAINYVVGSPLPLHVEAEGSDLTYRWQAVNTPGQQIWTNTTISGYDTSTLNISPTAAYNGRKYRCLISAGGDNYVYTRATTIYDENQ